MNVQNTELRVKTYTNKLLPGKKFGMRWTYFLEESSPKADLKLNIVDIQSLCVSTMYFCRLGDFNLFLQCHCANYAVAP